MADTKQKSLDDLITLEIDRGFNDDLFEEFSPSVDVNQSTSGPVQLDTEGKEVTKKPENKPVEDRAPGIYSADGALLVEGHEGGIVQTIEEVLTETREDFLGPSIGPAQGMMVDTLNELLAAKQGHVAVTGNLKRADQAASDFYLESGINPDPNKYVQFVSRVTGEDTLYFRDPEYEISSAVGLGKMFMLGVLGGPEGIRRTMQTILPSTRAIRMAKEAEAEMTTAGKQATAVREAKKTETASMSHAAQRSRADRDMAIHVEGLVKKHEKLEPEARAAKVQEDLIEYFKAAKTPQIMSELEMAKAVQRARQAALVGPTKISSDATLRLMQFVEDSQRAGAKTAMDWAKLQFKRIPLMLWDQSYNMKREIAKAFGKVEGTQGYRIMSRFLNIPGASTSARTKFFEARQIIYTGLNDQEWEVFDQVMMYRRAETIASYKKVHVLGGSKFETTNAREALQAMEARYGPAVIQNMEARADEYFNTIREQLIVMNKNGLLSDEELTALSKFDWEPMQLLDRLDPTIKIPAQGNRTISISSSGIQPLGKGGRDLINIDSEFLLHQFFMRTEGRIAKNNANKELYRAALLDPDNGLIHLKKPSEGNFTRLSTMIGGERKSIFLPSELTKEWVGGPTAARELVEKFGIITLANLTRPLATGMNVAFAFRNFFREIHGAWMKTDIYNSILPIARMQQWKDILAVAPDVLSVNYKGLAKEFIEQGGATRFIAQQGHLNQFTENPILRNLYRHNTFKRAIFAAEYLGERAEMLIRVSVYKRSLALGKSPIDAARVAREIIDFDQGGILTKSADAFMPYLNASVQGVRSMFRAAKDNPKLFTWKLGQHMIAGAGWYMMNRNINAEGWDQIPDREKMNNLIMMTPFSYKDSEGLDRYLYIKIPTEQSMRPFIAFTNAMMDKFYLNKDPSRVTRSTMEGMKEALAIVPGAGNIPLFAAIQTYASNVDAWSNLPVWRGNPDVAPEAQIESRAGRRPTGQLAKDISAMVSPVMKFTTGDETSGLSPVKLEAATRKVIPRNPITDSMLLTYNVLAKPGELPPGFQQTDLEKLRDIPFINSMVGFTHPFTQYAERMDFYKMIGATERHEYSTQIDNILAAGRMEEKQAHNQARTFARANIPQSYQRWARDRILADQRLRVIAPDKLFGKGGIPPRSTFLNTRDMPPEIRGEYWAEVYSSSDDKTRAKIRNILMRMPGMGKGEFWRTFNKEKNRLQAAK